MLFSNANVTHSCSVDLTLQCVMSGGRGLVVWNRPPSRPQMFFCWGFFFVCLFFKTCGDQLTHIASAGAISETLHSSLCTHKRHCIIILHMQHSATTGW